MRRLHSSRAGPRSVTGDSRVRAAVDARLSTRDPQTPQAVRYLNVLAAVGPGALSPTQIVVDAGAAGSVRKPQVQNAVSHLKSRLVADPEVAFVKTGTVGRFVDPSGRYAQLIVAGHHAYGDEPSQESVSRLRHSIIPSAGFPETARVLAGGGPAQGVDFLKRSYGAFPWLVFAVLVLTYFLLMRAFRSVVPPLKAVLLNLLSVGAAYGMLVLVFRWGVGNTLAGLYSFPQIEGWIPVFLFATLFGLYGLRGLHRLAHARDLGRGARQRSCRLLRARAHRDDRHRRGTDHGRCVLRLRRRVARRAAAVRVRARGRHLLGRDDRASTARSVLDGSLRPLELVATGFTRARRACGALAADTLGLAHSTAVGP